MKQIVVVVVNSSKSVMEVYNYINEEEAKKYVKERYLIEIQNAPYYDFENSYISKNFRKAKVCAGNYNVRISLCSNVRNGNKKSKCSGYYDERKAKHLSNMKIRMQSKVM